MKNLLKAFGTLAVAAFFVIGLAYNSDYTTIQTADAVSVQGAASELAPEEPKVTCPGNAPCTVVKGQKFYGVPTFEF